MASGPMEMNSYFFVPDNNEIFLLFAYVFMRETERERERERQRERERERLAEMTHLFWNFNYLFSPVLNLFCIFR